MRTSNVDHADLERRRTIATPSLRRRAGTCGTDRRFGADGMRVASPGAVDQDEWNEPVACCDCGAAIWPDVDRAFACSPEAYLCFACAERRGGTYALDEERWTVAPDVAGLPDERQAHP
jgi:hypothetical protein